MAIENFSQKDCNSQNDPKLELEQKQQFIKKQGAIRLKWGGGKTLMTQTLNLITLFAASFTKGQSMSYRPPSSP